VQYAREIQFLENIDAFMRRDFAALEAAWRPDVVMTLPGSSWLAGTYEGYDDVSRGVLGLRQVLDSEQKQITFLHEGDQMIVRHDIEVHGSMHVVEMTLRVRMRYDEGGKVEAILVEPEDIGLFDHVVNVVLQNQSTG
jgi:ketosteroid isomerase-like protein